MSSRPIQRARLAQLDQLGEEEAFRLYLEHGSVVKVCKAIFTPKDKNATRWGVDEWYRWLKQSPERKARWQEMLETRGMVEADLALEAADEATKDNVNVQRLKVDVHKWRAGLFNRDYRPGQSSVQVNVGVQVGMAWLAALDS